MEFTKDRLRVAKVYSIESCRLHFQSLFVFGDNLERVGKIGQAIIRDQINAVGLATKKKPSMEDNAFFTDTDLEENKKIIDLEIDTIKAYYNEKGFKELICPQFGLGTGLSAMPQRCPLTFCYLTERLVEEFGFNNINFLKPMA